jgi:hypothetical protein
MVNTLFTFIRASCTKPTPAMPIPTRPTMPPPRTMRMERPQRIKISAKPLMILLRCRQVTAILAAAHMRAAICMLLAA